MSNIKNQKILMANQSRRISPRQDFQKKSSEQKGNQSILKEISR